MPSVCIPVGAAAGDTVPPAECDCADNDREYTGADADERTARLQRLASDPREHGPKEEYRCPVCGDLWVADFPYHHWAPDKRGTLYLRRYETLRTGRPLNALP